MKKYLFLVMAFLLAGAMTASAQFKFGVKAGVNMANVSLEGDVGDNFALSNLTGFKAGPMIEAIIPVLGLGFDAAVLYSQQGMKIKEDEIRKTYKLNALEVPVNLKWKGLFGIYGAVGPYVQFKLSENLEDQFKAKSFGAGLNFGAGIELLKLLQVGANYQLGLTDDYSNFANRPFLKGRTATWSVTAALLF
jgi:hypothetical protein